MKTILPVLIAACVSSTFAYADTRPDKDICLHEIMTFAKAKTNYFTSDYEPPSELTCGLSKKIINYCSQSEKTDVYRLTALNEIIVEKTGDIHDSHIETIKLTHTINHKVLYFTPKIVRVDKMSEEDYCGFERIDIQEDGEEPYTLVEASLCDDMKASFIGTNTISAVEFLAEHPEWKEHYHIKLGPNKLMRDKAKAKTKDATVILREGDEKALQRIWKQCKNYYYDTAQETEHLKTRRPTKTKAPKNTKRSSTR